MIKDRIKELIFEALDSQAKKGGSHQFTELYFKLRSYVSKDEREGKPSGLIEFYPEELEKMIEGICDENKVSIAERNLIITQWLARELGISFGG